MAVDSGVLVIAFVHDRRAEVITDLGIGAGQRVVKANPHRYVIGNAEGLISREQR
jgi:hypothetical protein